MIRFKDVFILRVAALSLVLVFSIGFATSAQAMKITLLGYKPQETGGGSWTGGNLGKTWAEGEWVPYQFVLEEVSPGLLGLDSIVIAFDFHNSSYRFVDLARGIQVGTTRLSDTQAWPKPDGSAFPVGTREQIEIAQNHPLENFWSHFTDLNLPNSQINRTMSGGLDVPPGTAKHIFKIYKSDLLAAGIDINEDTVVVYYQLHESRTFIWQNRLQAAYSDPPADSWGGYLYGTDAWDTVSVLGSGYVPGASGHVNLEAPGSGQTIPIPIPEWEPGTAGGLKWRDDNGNGVQDGGEPPLSGWEVHVSGTVEGFSLSASTYTDESGEYAFLGLTAGTWTIKEDEQRDDPVETGYSQTYPTVGMQVGQGTAVAVGPPPPDAAPVGWEVELTLSIRDQSDLNFGNQGCHLMCDVTPECDSVCVGFDASFTAIGSDGTPPYSYDWSGPDGFTATTATININNAQPVNAGTYEVIVSDAHDCADTCYAELIVHPPLVIIVPQDDSVHAGDYFVSKDFSVSGAIGDLTVSLCGITPTPVHQPTIVENHVEWQVECADDGKIFTICLEAAADCGARDTGYFDVTVYNHPPELTCPGDGIVHAIETFVSNDFSVTDPDGDPTTVTFLDINPSATNDPQVVDQHVEWVTTFSERGPYDIRLIATDPCGLADTCEFTVTVDEPTGEFSCPDNDSVHAGNLFISTNFTLTYPECGPSAVEILDITPPVTNVPTIVDYHVEWLSTCAEEGDYVIRLMLGEDCWAHDTCEFTVTVYNRPPELICPDFAWVNPTQTLISTDFYTMDPDGDDVTVVILDIDPPGVYYPVIVGNHIEWCTTCCDQDYIIRLVATDPCGLADTCEFMVRVSFQRPPDFSLSVDPSTRLVPPGGTGEYSVGLTSILGFANPCSLSVCWMPDPPNSALFDQEVMTPTAFTGLDVYTTPQTDTGIYTMIVTGKEIGGPVVHHRPIQLNVQETSHAGDEMDESANLPDGFTLFQNQPNPFNPETQISYFLPQDCQVRLTIYNLLGQRVKTLYEGHQGAGIQTLTWDGTNDQGQKLSSGIYFYRLQAEQFQQTKKMVLMK
jgi:hypothetical protein